MIAMETLIKWLRHCSPRSQAAEGIMDGVCAAMVSMVLADEMARQRDAADEPPLLAIPQRFWLRERDLRSMREEIARKPHQFRTVAGAHFGHEAACARSKPWPRSSGQEQMDEAAAADADELPQVAAEGSWVTYGDGRGFRAAGEGEEESEWEVAVDDPECEGGRVQADRTVCGRRQLGKGPPGRLHIEEALLVADMVREACKRVSTCIAFGQDERRGTFGRREDDGQEHVDDGMGLISWRRGMCTHWPVGQERPKGVGSCRADDQLRRLEAMALCIEHLCGHPTRQVAWASVACIRLFARIPLALASEQCPRLARACLPLLLPRFQLRRCSPELGFVEAYEETAAGATRRAIAAISACIVRDQVGRGLLRNACLPRSVYLHALHQNSE